MSLMGITTITLLKSRVSQEDASRGSGKKLVLFWSENMKKNKYNQRREKEGNKVVSQGKEVNEESDHVTQMRAYD